METDSDRQFIEKNQFNIYIHHCAIPIFVYHKGDVRQSSLPSNIYDEYA